MTVLEFEKWVSEHYDELVAAALKVTQHSDRAVDALHGVIEHICSGHSKLPAEQIGVGWVASATRHAFLNLMRDDRAAAAKLDIVRADARVLGLDGALSDPRRDKQRLARRRYKDKAKGKEISPSATGLALIGNPGGTARWRYQTLRDDRLFIKRAIRSQAESIWAAVKRQAHGLERGHSYTEFGLEASK